jgi:hypothetical protein
MIRRGAADEGRVAHLLFSEECTEDDVVKFFMDDTTFKVKPNTQVVRQSQRLGRFSSTVRGSLIFAFVYVLN